MANYKYMMCADDVAKELGCSKSYAYKVVRKLNGELSKLGYITIAGHVPRTFWETKMYGYRQSEK